LDIVIELYQQNGQTHGHLTELNHYDTKIEFRLNAMTAFFERFASKEKDMVERKYNSQQAFFPDPLVLRNLYIRNDQNMIYFEKYRSDYYQSKFAHENISVSDIVRHYLDGMNWILHYYQFGMPDWSWFYPFSYGPFLVDFKETLSVYTSPTFVLHQPLDPFLQLMIVLPENSKSLMPPELMDVSSHLKSFFPDVIEIDLTGKKKEWEGIVILPSLQIKQFESFYAQRLPRISVMDKKRNIQGKTFMYHFNPMKRYLFSSFYGNIYDCPIVTTILHF